MPENKQIEHGIEFKEIHQMQYVELIDKLTKIAQRLNEIESIIGGTKRKWRDDTDRRLDILESKHTKPAETLVPLDEDEVYEFSIKFWEALAKKTGYQEKPPVTFLTNLCELICQRFGQPSPATHEIVGIGAMAILDSVSKPSPASEHTDHREYDKNCPTCNPVCEHDWSIEYPYPNGAWMNCKKCKERKWFSSIIKTDASEQNTPKKCKHGLENHYGCN